MSINSFPENLEVLILDSNGSSPMGGYSIDTEIELQYVSVMIFKHGTLSGSERMRVKVANDAAGTRILHTSAWSNISDIPSVNAGDWLGWLRFDSLGKV